MADKKCTGPVCSKCKAPMVEAYELDVPVITRNKDTLVRRKHRGYLCRDHLTTTVTIDGKLAGHGQGKAPKGAHPRMAEILRQCIKGIKVAKA